MDPGGGGGGGGGEGQGLSSDDAAAVEDRLSALPSDVLVLILLNLSTRDAARTSVLSRRWRRIWALLPVLRFTDPPAPDSHRLRDLLDGHEVLLRDLLVVADDETSATAESLAAWLPAAARRVAGDLTLQTYADGRGAGGGAAAAFELPCFDKATTVSFSLNFQGLAVPLAAAGGGGVFERLTALHLSRVRFHGPGELGDAVSSRRCPCLRSLTVEDALGLGHLAIRSDSLLSMDLRDSLGGLSRLTVATPALEQLAVGLDFLEAANISAPLLTKLDWAGAYDPTSVHLGKMACLQWLGIHYYVVYGGDAFMINQSRLSLLQRFKGIKSLFLMLLYPRGIKNDDHYNMEDIVVLPDITLLGLMIIANGHAFEASVFHVLRLCTGIRKLTLLLVATESKAQAVCSSDCKCVQLVEWETEELLLNHLEEVEIKGWRGTEHEVALVKRLFDWGTKLKEMRVQFCDSISEVKAKKMYQIFQSFYRRGVCMKFRHQESSKVLCAPKH